MDTNKVALNEIIGHEAGWDWENSHVSQSYVDRTGNQGQRSSVAYNDIIESGTVLIAAGPADLDKAASIIGVQQGNTGGIRIVPIGLVETAQISMNKPLSRIFEIGSKLSYIIPGRAVGGMSLSRVFFDGPSLLKAVYMGEVQKDSADTDWKYVNFLSDPQEGWYKFAHIGSGNLALNLASSFFDQPLGLAFYFKNHAGKLVGEIYFEGCRISSHNIGFSANMNVITEAINMEFIRCRPIITSSTSDWVSGKTIADLNITSASSEVPPSTTLN